MIQEQQSPADWMVSNVRDLAGASAQQVKETSKANLEASRAVMDAYREAASILQDRGDNAFHTAMAVMEAGFDASLEQFNRMAAVQNLQDVIRLQMTWGANEILAICRALGKTNGNNVQGGGKPGKAANA